MKTTTRKLTTQPKQNKFGFFGEFLLFVGSSSFWFIE